MWYPPYQECTACVIGIVIMLKQPVSRQRFSFVIMVQSKVKKQSYGKKQDMGDNGKGHAPNPQGGSRE